jgi:excisionase family DNA binding protein
MTRWLTVQDRGRLARAIGINSFIVLLVALFLVTPVGDWWLWGLMDLSPELVALAKTAIWLGVPIAALTVAQSWYQGLLVNTRRTRGVSEAVAVYLVVDGLLLVAGVAVGTVAGLLGVSSRHVYRLADAGRMPRPLKLGGARRWDRVAIESWIADGCPATTSTHKRGGSR